MRSLGFESVYNKNEDFYAARESKAVPEFDCLVTNPPFSSNHIENLLEFCVTSKKPWAILMPQYIARKDFYLEWLNKKRTPKPSNAFAVLSGAKVDATSWPKPHFLGPATEPYVFEAPAAREDVARMRHKVTTDDDNEEEDEGKKEVDGNAEGGEGRAGHEGQRSHVVSREEYFNVTAGSFQCVWFINFGPKHHGPVMDWYEKQSQPKGNPSADIENRKDEGQEEEEGGGDEAVLASDVCLLPQLTVIDKAGPALDHRGRTSKAKT